MDIKSFSRILFAFLFFSLISIDSFSQENTQAIRQAAASTVTIKISGPTGNKFATGFFIGKNLIVSNFHFFKDATAASCIGDEAAKSYEIPGSLAEDDISDLILLKVNGLESASLKIAVGQPPPRITSKASEPEVILVLGNTSDATTIVPSPYFLLINASTLLKLIIQSFQ